MSSWRLKIPSLPDNVRIVESFIDNVKDHFQFNEDIYGDILIAVTESVNNAIRHGNKGDASKNVDLSLEVGSNSLCFTIKDEGKGFDYDDLPDPTDPEHLTNIGGRGIFIIKHLADEVKFLARGNTIQLIFHL
ncbi:MAG: ATP-binding protein [Bacteroidetes bacterium]|nr:MAG: ATP-binding protein [Bacteroidota bacterium]